MLGRRPERYDDPPVTGKRVTFSAESTLASVYNEKKVARTNSARACSGCVPLTELTPLGESCKMFIWRNVVPATRVTRLTGPPF